MEDCLKQGKGRPVACARAGRAARLLILTLFCGLVFSVGGCTRAFFRRQADKEVADILHEKDVFPEWKIEQFHPYPDPRARFASPHNPDRPPMPPDDEAAWKLAPHPQQPGHAGVAATESTTYLDIVSSWDAQNRASLTADRSAPRTGPLQSLFDLPVNEQQGYLLKHEQTVELGLINSREYQNFREELYVLALPVTQQRFSFAWQWAAIENAVRQWAGPESTVGRQNNWDLGTGVGVTKLFSTGALLTMSFANNTVFNFVNGSNRFTSGSTVNLDLVQPLLRGGGKAVALEPLTQAERNLVYSIRSFARFREQFYASITLGSSLPSNLAAAAGAQESTTGSSVSNLAAVGIANTDVAGPFRGYLPSLFRQFSLVVDRKYVADLEKALRLFEGFQEGGQINPLQVQQVQSTLFDARSAVLKDQQDVANALDQFKLQLGLPANLPLLLDDNPALPITRELDRYYEVLTDADEANRLVDAQDKLAADKLRPFLKQLYTTAALVRGTNFQKAVAASWETWSRASDQDIKAGLEKLGQARRNLLNLKTELEVQGKPLPPREQASLREIEFESDLGSLEQILRRYEARPWEKLTKVEQQRQDRTKLFRLVSYSAELVLVWARNERFERVGQLWPALPKVPIDGIDLLDADLHQAQEAAVQAALTNRWDLMNARAQVVDDWRQLAVNANALLGVLNVQYHLDSTTPPGGSQPLAFSSAATNQELIINAQLPLVRVPERNRYRIALFNYERSRRNLMSLQDNIAAQVRSDVRQLHLFAENYRIQQKVLESLYSQVENSLEVIVAPVDPDQLKASGTSGAANAAALTNQYLGALRSLNGAQTRIYDIWLSYLATRMQLYLDLERLPLDLRGVWIDESGNHCPGNDELSHPERDAERGPATLVRTTIDRAANGASAARQSPAHQQRAPGRSEPARARLLAPAATAPLD